MTPRSVRLSRAGQLTIPIAIHRALDLNPGDRVVVEQQGDAILARRAGSIAEHTAGLLKAYRPAAPLSADEERDAFGQAVADEGATSD